MQVSQPFWSLLLIPLSFAILRMPIRRRLKGLLAAVGAIIILALTDPGVLLGHRAGTLVVLVDTSASMPEDRGRRAREVIDLLRAGQPADARMAVISYAEDAVVNKMPDRSFSGFSRIPEHASNLQRALQRAGALIERSDGGRLLLISDGLNDDRGVGRAIANLAQRGIAVDYRPMTIRRQDPLSVLRVDAPSRVEEGEQFVAVTVFHSDTEQDVQWTWTKNDVQIGQGSVHVVPGEHHLVMRDHASHEGTAQYRLSLDGDSTDAVPQNNRARIFNKVEGRSRVLLLSQSSDTSLARLLRASGIDVDSLRAQPGSIDLARLARYAAVVLENVPATELGFEGMEILAAWVRDSGGGLWMTGGPQSFGAGGYLRSPLEPVLPVSLEVRNEHRKIAVAMVVAMDRSGSMGAPVRGGIKMDLANRAAAEAMAMLGPADRFGIYAVDDRAHEIAPLAPLTNAESVRVKILSIRPGGGGIYIYEALSAGLSDLVEVQSGVRHLLLLADAADSEVPGDYRQLLNRALAAGITVSVVGLGTESASDAALLRDIAARGGGNVFFTENALELPQIFVQDMVLISRNPYVDEATPWSLTPELGLITQGEFSQPPDLPAYNQCWSRPDTVQGALIDDSFDSPALASWQVGAGRVLCLTADISSDRQWSAWPDLGDFLASLCRFVMRGSNSLSDGMVETEMLQGVLRVRLHPEPTATRSDRPELRVLVEKSGFGPRSQTLEMRRVEGSFYEADVPLAGDETALPVLGWGDQSALLPPAAPIYSGEFEPHPVGLGLENMRRLADAGGGHLRTDLTATWDDLPESRGAVELAPILIILAGALLLVAVSVRVLGLGGAARATRSRRSEPGPEVGTGQRESTRTHEEDQRNESDLEDAFAVVKQRMRSARRRPPSS